MLAQSGVLGSVTHQTPPRPDVCWGCAVPVNNIQTKTSNIRNTNPVTNILPRLAVMSNLDMFLSVNLKENNVFLRSYCDFVFMREKIVIQS